MSPRRRPLRWLLLAGLAAAGLHAGAAEPEATLDLTVGVQVAVRDGVRLHADLYRPKALPAPALLWMTPYGLEALRPIASRLAREGFAVATVDVRGGGASEGERDPWRADGRDGHDLVEWLAAQPWCTGKVGMLGHSYGGRAVWSTLKERPTHLGAAVPISPSFPFWGWRGMVGPDALQWLLLTGREPLGKKLATDPEAWAAKLREWAGSGRPLRDFDRVVGLPSPLFQRFLDHPVLDDFWTSVTPQPADFARLDLPILTIVGAYEGNQVGALWYYREHLRAAGGAARHRLLIGPWDHHGTLQPSAEAGGLPCGPASLLDLPALLAAFFRHALAGGPLPAELAHPLRYYVGGREAWATAESLAAVGQERRRFFLAAAARRLTLTTPGALLSTPRRGAVAAGWTYDPRDLRPFAAEPVEPTDWAVRLDAPDDLGGLGVAYQSPPLARGLTLAGMPVVSLWLRLDVPDADLGVVLDVLEPSGQRVLLGEDWLRARFRSSLARPSLVTPGKPFLARFELPFIARDVPAGSRLRLVVRSLHSLFLARNFNGGGEVAAESVRDARTAQVEVLGSEAHPSFVEVAVEPSPPAQRPKWKTAARK